MTATKLDKRTLKKLYSDLPYGASGEIKKRLAAQGYEFAASYIRAVLNPDDHRMNTIIIDVAIAYRDEVAAETTRRAQAILK